MALFFAESANARENLKVARAYRAALNEPTAPIYISGAGVAAIASPEDIDDYCRDTGADPEDWLVDTGEFEV